jgi:hypothetical protein
MEAQGAGPSSNSSNINNKQKTCLKCGYRKKKKKKIYIYIYIKVKTEQRG